MKINSFEEAKPFYKYTNPNSRWCLTHMENMFDTYTNHGNNTLYFAYKKGFENIKPIPQSNSPLDKYGLSLLSIIMSPDYGDGGSLAYCTCRWNHDNGGSDSVMNAQQLSNVLGGSVFSLCPSKKIEIKINGDLGLPSGTVWMTKNVGASSETDFGKYFAWNMTEGFYANEVGGDMFSEEWYANQNKVDWSSHQFEDGSHAPSQKQFYELINNCSYEFTNYNGVSGGMFTSKINGNSIFIPASGGAWSGRFFNGGNLGFLWSDSVYTSNAEYALGLSLGSGYCGVSYYYRNGGLCVRGVVS